MKTNIISKWTALLLTFSGMAALPLTVTAAAGDNKVVTSSTTETGQTYRSNDISQAALQVSGNGVIYTGTNITLTGTAETGAGRYGAYVYNRGRLDLYGGSASTTGSVTGGAMAVRVDGTSIANLHNVNISVMAGNGVLLTTSSTVVVIGGTITVSGSNGGHCGVQINSSSVAHLENITINIIDDGNARGFGVWGDTGSIVSGSGLSITTQGFRGYGLSLTGGAMMSIYNSTINTSGTSAVGAMVNTVVDGVTSSLWLNDVDITTTGEGACGLALGDSPNTTGITAIYATNVRVNTSGADASAVYLGNRPDGLQILEIDGGSYTAANGAGLYIANMNQTNFSDEYQVTIKGGATITGTVALLVEESGDNPQTRVTVDVADNSSLNGGITTTGSTNTTVNLDRTTLTGDVAGSNSGTLNINANASTLIGDIIAND
ncbi:MAG: hypothetical protein LBD30_04210, partial [Verrucomicrobiales bacterium]|nr:hypothetical protein [Verrucomicrobiales bacterium]